jgi:hypothetical protein
VILKKSISCVWRKTGCMTKGRGHRLFDNVLNEIVELIAYILLCEFSNRQKEKIFLKASRGRHHEIHAF